MTPLAPPVAQLTRSCALFGEQLALVGDDDWARDTNINDFDIRSLVAHIVIGDATATNVVSGGGVERVTEFDSAILGSEPLAAWRGTALAMIKAFSEPGALEAVYEFDGAELTGEALLGFRLSDGLVHAWDLAHAIDGELVLPDDLAEYVLDLWVGFMTRLDDAKFYGAGPIEPPVDATPGVRLLALMGRRDW